MSAPATEAGKALDLAWPGTHIDRLDWQERIAAIEQQAAAEAVARERERLLERVADLPRRVVPATGVLKRGEFVWRDDVLALLGPEG